MSWPFLDSTPTISLRIRNYVLQSTYPREGETQAVVDTGYEGFLLIPARIFREAGLGELKLQSRSLLAADGRRFITKGAYGAIELPALGKETEGFIEYNPAFQEILVGMQGLDGLVLEVDTCRKEASLRIC